MSSAERQAVSTSTTMTRFHSPVLPVYDAGSVTTGGHPIPGLMQTRPLLIPSLLLHAATYHPDREIVSCVAESPPPAKPFRYTNAQLAVRVKQLANALVRSLGVQMGEFIGTLAYNTHRHVECYYGISSIGAVLHTINPRLFVDQVEFIISHAEDKVLFVDLPCVPLLKTLISRGNIPSCRTYVIMVDEAHMPDLPFPALCYETLITRQPTEFTFPLFPETAASSCCYTSGTTGLPKGVIFTHKSTVLHAFSLTGLDHIGLYSGDTLLALVPLFHVNGWAVHYTACLVGAKIVLPGCFLEADNLCRLLTEEQCTLSVGVPTIWLTMLHHLEAHPEIQLPHLTRIAVGGSAAPRAMIDRLEQRGIQVIHAWGMTELSPIGTVGTLLPKHSSLSREEKLNLKQKQGRGVYAVEMQIVDDDGRVLPRDGEAYGELQVRGPWVTSGYYKLNSKGQPAHSWEEQNNTINGWFPTGDIATIDPDGYMKITDRAKDVIKSGGEWVSSIDLENAALLDSRIAEAAVIGAYHSKWVERPLLLAVKKPGTSVDVQSLLNIMRTRVAAWQLPDGVEFVEELPHTATGKLLKTKLREMYKDYRFASDPESKNETQQATQTLKQQSQQPSITAKL